jgi:hypothetical protein
LQIPTRLGHRPPVPADPTHDVDTTTHIPTTDVAAETTIAAVREETITDRTSTEIVMTTAVTTSMMKTMTGVADDHLTRKLRRNRLDSPTSLLPRQV